MNFLKKQIIIKKTVGSVLLDSITSALAFSCVLFICLNNFSEPIQELLKSVSNGDISALNVSIFLLPIIIIISLLLKLGVIFMKKDNKK